jgi:hypothetical protein
MAELSKPAVWTGRVLTALMALFLVMDAVMKFFVPQPVAEAFTRLGISTSLSVPIGVMLLACVVLYLIPRTAVLGAVLLTGYLGGAIAIHMRAGSSLFGETLFPIYMGAVIWLGLYLRDSRVRGVLS